MFHFLLGLQICVFLICLICTVGLVRLKSFIDLKFLILAAICEDIYAAGYLIEMTAGSQDVAMAAYAFQYMGLAFVAFFYAMFVFRFCGDKRIPMWVWYVAFAFCCLVVFLVFFYKYNNLFYSSIEFIEDGIFPHVRTKKGIVFIIFGIWEGLALGASSLLLLRKRGFLADKGEKRKITLLFTESLIAIISMLAVIFGFTGGYDSGSLCIGIMLVLTTVTATYGRAFDVVGIARDDMFTTVSTGLIVTDLKHIYLDSNDAARQIFPELEELEPGRSHCIHEEEIFTDKNDFYFDKGEKSYHVRYSPIYNKTNTKSKLVGYTVIIADVTDVRRQMKEIQALKEAADAASEAKSAFLASMSHEIRTPLNAIIGMAELTGKEQNEAVIKEYVSQIKAAGEVLLGIISDVLDFSKAESGKLDLVPVDFEFADFINSIINIINMRIGDKPIDFIVDVDPKIPRVLYGNDVHIRQIFMNLLGNAEKYTDKGHIKLTVNFREEEKVIRLYGIVEDTGIGIKEEHIGELFNAFTQLDVKKNRWKEGSGLGLAIFAQLVTLMNGTYKVESEYGKGSAFFFNIAVEVGDRTPFGGQVRRSEFRVPKLAAFSLYNTTLRESVSVDSEIASEISDYSDKKILVVDDNKVNVRVISAFLKHFNIVPDAAYSGQEAIDMVQRKKYDLIFMDQMMPEMDGIETTVHIRELEGDYYKEIPIVACTANVVKGVEDTLYQAGMNDFVPKPIRFENLEAKLAKFFNR